MHTIDISKVDLNLLVVLDALLARGSVTAAARALGLTQPTVSHALSRLRALLQDPVLVRVGRGMEQTPRAQAIAPALRRLLADASAVLEHRVAFDASTSKRVFRVACPDLMVAFLPDLLRRFAKSAPAVGLEVRPPSPEASALLGLGTLDVSIERAGGAAPGLIQRTVGTLRWCVLARRAHPAAAAGLTDVATWLASPHVVVGTAEGVGVVGSALAKRGLTRSVAFVAPSFLAAAHAVRHTDWFFAAPRELSEGLARELGLALLEPPMALPSVKVALFWHERMDADDGHRWLRTVLAEVLAAALEGGRVAATAQARRGGGSARGRAP